jgi:acyl carrier protein
MDLQTTLTEYITKELAIGRSKAIAPDDDLVATGVLDSLGLMQLVLFIDEKLGIHIPDEDVVIDNFRTIRILAEYLTRQQSLQASGGAA